MFLNDKTALITGATSGIGAAYATALAAEGAAIMINGFGEPSAIAAQLAALSLASGTGALHDGADMTDAAAIRAMVARCHDELGGPHIVINNAGIQHVAPVERFPPDKWRQIMAIMLDGPFHVMQAAIPHMKAAGWGRLIATTSAHASVASPNKSAYIAAKHGVLGLTRTVALELARDGITANCISPGYVWTPLVENQIPATMATRGMTRDQVINDVLLAAQPTKQFVTPEQVAALALFLCSDAASAITGANMAVDGGWTTQ